MKEFTVVELLLVIIAILMVSGLLGYTLGQDNISFACKELGYYNINSKETLQCTLIRE